MQWRGPWAISLFSFYVFLAQYLEFLKREDCLKYFLTDASFNDLMKYKADFVVSCGSQAAGINFIIKPKSSGQIHFHFNTGPFSQERFDVVVLPEHDRPRILQTGPFDHSQGVSQS